MGKKVNLYGYTLAEKLIAFEGAINDLYSLLGDLGFYVTKEAFIDEATIYNVSFMTQPILENSFIGRPIYFINNQITAYVNTYNPANGQFTINSAHTIRGERGEQGIQGIPGINGTNGTNGSDGRGITSVTDIKDSQADGYTVSTLRVDYTEGDFDQIEIRAKNGTSAPIVEITDVPTTAKQGTLSEEQLITLQSDNMSAILFNNELYYPMDKMLSEGYYTYVHNGYDNSGNAFAEKVIVITLSTRGWVLSIKPPSKKLFKHNLTFPDSYTFQGTTYSVTFRHTIINTSPTPITYISPSTVGTPVFLAGASYDAILGIYQDAGGNICRIFIKGNQIITNESFSGGTIHVTDTVEELI